MLGTADAKAALKDQEKNSRHAMDTQDAIDAYIAKQDCVLVEATGNHAKQPSSQAANQPSSQPGNQQTANQPTDQPTSKPTSQVANQVSGESGGKYRIINLTALACLSFLEHLRACPGL
jgi:hypothetical protein